ncbi:bifunctional glutamyl/prolyl-tRNA synthetase [Nematocida sp. LUAm3]|nr:bifunctional glutamyl/prolyl-tRNA synthetase [Nematocida sp. LUAm3]KAI5173536.1 bifunctional glutamyl/prolyl-tRNA synthetase [Nematocida sp. LUAm2]KAI5176757.1 bifunctional glutamyl/prolyl-tRNA synthetase [Nematocida sp. LUAm1]
MSKTQKFSIEAKQEEEFPRWYKEILTKAEILDYHDINGCYVLRPNGFFIWNQIRKEFTKSIEELDVEEAYFPMLLSKSALEKEKDHLDSFSPEVAWITECGGKQLENPVAIRPTSEAIIYPYFSKWLQSYRDLPIKINQWCNVLRWETTQTMPFIRGREFLWQEGHTAHFLKEDAEKEVLLILDLYKEIYEKFLAVPVIQGKKSKKETFAGADYTTTVEAFIPETGRGIQAATSHFLGTNFSKMFKVCVEDPKSPGTHLPVYQNSWGLSTRSIGVALLTHSDNRGAVIPPKVAPIQVIIIPCGLNKSTDQETRDNVLQTAQNIQNALKNLKIRAKIDLSSNSPGHKFNHWEVRGVPLRVEIGPKDLSTQQVTLSWRISQKKRTISLSNIHVEIENELESIQSTMYYNAKVKRDSSILKADTVQDILSAIQNKKMAKAPWCGEESCESSIKERTSEVVSGVSISGAKSLCIPFSSTSQNIPPNCFACSNSSTCIGLFGRSY